MTSQLWALLVGINYEGTAIRQLSGCVNDVEAMQRFLIEQMGVPKAQIKMLTEQEAKRATIIKTFKEFLIENKDIPKGAQILFHFSGHGSQMLSRSKFEPDGRDETIVPYDSRTRNVYDIPDKTLAGMLRKLAEKKGNNITVVLDCCHSGSGTRALDDAILQTRRIDPSLVRLPDGVDEEWYATIDSSNRSLGPSGWESNDSQHVLIAGCRAHEESREHRPPSGDRMTFGALTYFMLDWLRTKPAGATYGDLHEAVATQVNTIYKDQMPQCEGDRNRQVFGGATVARDPFAKVTAVHGNEVTLDCGVTQGMSVDTELAIYPATVKTRSECKKSNILAKAKITQAGGTSATAGLVGTPQQAIEVNCRVLITKRPIGGTRTAVWAVSLPNGDSAALTERIKDSDLLSQAKERAMADVELRYADGNYRFYDLSGRELCEHSTEMNGACDKLEHMARYRLVQMLNNEDRKSPLQVKATLCRYGTAQAVASNEAGEFELFHDDLDDERNRYEIKIENGETVPIYANVLYLSSDFSVHMLYPQQHEPKQIAAKTHWIYGRGDNDKLYIGLNEGEISTSDRIKIICTTKPIELHLLAQDGLAPPTRSIDRGTKRKAESDLEKIIRLKTSGNRSLLSPKKKLDDAWATLNLAFRVERAQVEQDLHRGIESEQIKIRGGAFEINKPVEFEGKITVEPFAGDVRRNVGEGIQLPPALTQNPDLYQLLDNPSTRSIEKTGLVIKIEVNDQSRNMVTANTPLTLDIKDFDPNAQTVVVTHDGEDFLIVGGGDQGVVTINTLPPDQALKRADVKRSMRLYVYKKIGRQTSDLGLHYYEPDGNVNTPRKPNPSDFQKGNTVALMVHGFLSDTKWMAKDVAQFLHANGKHYDHVLGWNYETVGTGVNQNGLDLAGALQNLCGFTADDEITIHVYAHSMGCLVTRCLIELHGGHEFIDKVVLAGPPNLGTMLANATKGFTQMLSLLLNDVITIPGVSWLGKGIDLFLDNSPGWDDLKTDSMIVSEINALAKPDHVPYLILAGLNEPNQQQLSVGARIAHKLSDPLLDQFYGEANDLVIGKHCMTDLRYGGYPNKKICYLKCNHNDYYDDQKARNEILQWI